MSLHQGDSNSVREPMPPVPTPLIPLPPWAERSLRHLTCTKCKRSPGRRDVTAISIRRRDGHPNPVFCYEFECPQCREPLLVYLPKRELDAIGLAEAILDGDEHVLPEDRAIDLAAERSWDQRETRETLSRMSSHEQFLGFIGLSKADIFKHGTYRKRRKDSDNK